MRFIRSRFGIVLWCAIALLILIVPLWRLRAARQWNFASVQAALAPDYSSSRILIAGQPEPAPAPIPYGFTASDETAAARRFPNEPIARLARLDTGDIIRETNYLRISVTRYYYVDDKEIANAQVKLNNLRPRLLKVTEPYFVQYNKLEQLFPNSILVRAQHLRDVSSLAVVSDESLNTQSPEKRDGDARSQNYLLQNYISPVSSATLGSAIQSARKGARLAPDNAYFPWMEAIFQFALKRPNEALRALEAAGKCSTFDDYTFRNIDEQTQLLQRLRTTGWEDDVATQATAIFPHYSKMRAVARAASWQMQLARKRQDKSADFRWAAALARAAYPVARSERNSVICILVGESICEIAWRAAVQDEPNAPAKPKQGTPPPQRQQDYEEFNTNNAALFARIARAQGDDALAQQTLVISAAIKKREFTPFAQTDPGGLSALNFRLSIFYWLGAQLLRISLGGAAAWLVCWLLTRRLPIVAGARAKMLLPAMFCAGVTGAVLVGASLISPSLYGLLSGLYQNPTEDKTSWMIAALRDRWPLMLSLLWGILIVGGAITQLNRAQNEGNEKLFKPWPDAILWAIISIGLAPVFYFYPDFKPANFASDWIIYAATLISGVLFVAASFVSVGRSSGLKRVLIICLIGIFWTSFALPLLMSLVIFDAFDSLFLLGAIPFALGAFLSTLVLLIRGWSGSAPTKEIAFQLAARARIAAGVLALLCAVAYLGISLATIPVEARARAMMQRQLQIGGVAWLREQMPETQPLSTRAD